MTQAKPRQMDLTTEASPTEAVRGVWLAVALLTLVAGAALVALAVVMQFTGHPAATIANTIAFGVFAVIALGMAWVLYSPLRQCDIR